MILPTIAKKLAKPAQPAALAPLTERGWVCHATAHLGTEALLEETRALGDLLGTRAAGRARALEEIVRPRRPLEACPRSLSAHYGLDTLPFHVELSHRPRPCRYLLLGCIEPGSPSATTRLLDWRTLAFSPEDFQLLESAPVLVRSGRRSFYSTILSSDRRFLRYDPACLEAVDERGRSALKLLKHQLALGSSETHEWHRGDILIVDNWRVLHGRGPSAPDSGRSLARILIDA
jgi:Taurine catabolism dioxygenase TauD, TfdA family